MAQATAVKKALDYLKRKGAKIVDFKFIDMPGMWQHTSVPVEAVDEGAFVDGIGFDGSSIRGFQEIQESDMVLLPDPASARVDTFCAVPTVSFICDVFDPRTQTLYPRDPRGVAKRAAAYLKKSGIADVSYFGPELEFFIFDHLSFDVLPYMTGYAIDSEEAHWNSGDNDSSNGGYSLRPKEGYYPVAPSDKHMDVRSEMVLTLQDWGVPVEMHHHEVATAGQTEIDIRYNDLVTQADNVMIYKYVTRNVARKYGKTVTFMPKPLFGDNGSGMHVHQSLWKGKTNLFYDKGGYAELSKVALYYIGGLLTHIDALLAFCAPTTNSYKRLVPHFEAPVKLAYSARNRSASIRIPHVSNPKGRRIETRFPDPMANPYFAFSALMMAGLDGVQNKIHPGEAADKNLYDLPPEEDAKIPTVCAGLDQALDALDKDREFLTRGGVFTDSMLDAYIELKTQELQRFRQTTHPVEFDMYYSL